MSFHGLGALGAVGDDVEIDYYAAPAALRWRNNDWKRLHDKLVSLDGDWQRLVLSLSGAGIPGIPAELNNAITLFARYPMPVVAEIALFLEVIGGQRALDDSCVSLLRYADGRLTGAAGGMAALAATAGIIGGIAVVAPFDLGITATTAATIAGMSTVSAGALAALGRMASALADGTAPNKNDLALVVGGSAALVGGTPPSTAAQEAARASLATSLASEEDTFREDAIERAKRKSLEKRRACAARGGVFDARAPGGCRVIDPKRTAEKLRQAGLDVKSGQTNLLVPAGLAALGILGVWLISRPKPRANPKPKRRRRRR